MISHDFNVILLFDVYARFFMLILCIVLVIILLILFDIFAFNAICLLLYALLLVRVIVGLLIFLDTFNTNTQPTFKFLKFLIQNLPVLLKVKPL